MAVLIACCFVSPFTTRYFPLRVANARGSNPATFTLRVHLAPFRILALIFSFIPSGSDILGLLGLLGRPTGENSTPPLAPNKSIYLDAIRATAAQLVLWNHVRALFLVNYQSVEHPSTPLMVFYACSGLGGSAIFFVLSGYLIGSSTLRDMERDTWSWKKYLTHRLTRLLVVLVPALLLGLMWDSIGLHTDPSDMAYLGKVRRVLRYPVSDALNWKAFLGNLCFMQNLHISGVGRRVVPTLGSNVPLWSLAHDFWYYITFPMLCLAARKDLSRLKRWIFLLVACAILFMLPSIREGFAIWLMGAALFFAPRLRSLKGTALTIVTLIAAIAVGTTLLFQRYDRASYRTLVVGVACAVLIYLISHHTGSNIPQALTKAIRFMAASSYTLYLTHLPFLFLIHAAVSNDGWWQPTPKSLVFVFCIAGITILYSIALYFCFERNTYRLRTAIAERVVKAPPVMKAKAASA